MKVFIACWFDRHIDPLIEAFEDCEDAIDQLDLWSDMREYDYIRTWHFYSPEELEGNFGWMWEGPWTEYITAKMDDGPHGYVLLKEIR